LGFSLPGRGQVGHGVGDGGLGSRYFGLRIAVVRAHIRCVQGSLGRLKLLPRGGYLGLRCRAGGSQPGERIEIVLRLVDIQLFPGNISGRGLALFLGSVVRGRIERGLG
jgi:hypothetical protein